MKKIGLLIPALWCWFGTFGQVAINAGSTVIENFAIGTSATASMPTGWKADKLTTVRTVGSYAAAATSTEQRAGNDMSSTATNGIYNFGAGVATATTERAVGGLSSGSLSKSVNIYLHLFNSGLTTINDFTISYGVEKYRKGTNASGFSVQMYYSSDGTSWTSAGPGFLTSFPGSDPDNGGFNPAPGSTMNITGATLPVMLSAGSDLYLAWNYSVTSETTTTSAQALGIDDVIISANPFSSQVSTYSWNQPGTADWTLPSNWNPSRVAPQESDILYFSLGGTCTLTNVPSQTIGQLLVYNNTVVNLQSNSGTILSLTGGSGVDLEVQENCKLKLNGAHPVSIALATGSSGYIAGELALDPSSPAANHLFAADAGSVIFGFGGTFTAGAFNTGSPFGATALESVIFTNGSVFIHEGGDAPFGASQPNSVAVFQAGSLYKVTGNVPLSLSGRNYANFELDAAGMSFSPDGSFPVSIDNLTVTNGQLNFNMTGTTGHSIKGNIYLAAGGKLTFTPAQAGTVTFNGTCTQAISGVNTITGNTNSTLEIANSDGINLGTDLITEGNIRLTNGLLTLGGHDLFLGVASAILGTPSASAMVVATGRGQVKKEFPGPGSFLFPVGDQTLTTEYSPVTLSFNSGTFGSGNRAGVSLVNSKYPTDTNTGNYLYRYWNLSTNSISSYSCDAHFQYVPADVAGTENLIYCIKPDTVHYINYDIANPATHQLTARGITAPGSFTGSQSTPNIYQVTGTGSYCQGNPGLPVSLSGSELNASYQLKKNGIDHGSPVTGTGAPLSWENQMAATYAITATNVKGISWMSGDAAIEEIPSLPAVVTIVADANPVCEGSLVAFTASITNGGTTPVFLWKINNTDAGTNNSQFSYTPSNGDVISCILTSGASCAIGNPDTSNLIVMTVHPAVAVSITIDPSSNPVCPDTPVTFTATALNGGSNPSFQWKINGLNAGSNSQNFTCYPADNDLVTCELTSGVACATGNPATSNTVNMQVNEILPVGISVEVSANPVCTGTLVTFTATPVNGGTNPTYQWRVNGVVTGTNSPYYEFTPDDGDHVACVLTSNLPCVSCNPAISNEIIMTVNSEVSMNSTVSGTIGARIDTSFSALETITVAGDASSFVVQYNGWATMFAGEKINYLPGTKVETGGYLLGQIASGGLSCGSMSPSIITSNENEFNRIMERSSFVVYPNPSDGNFTLGQRSETRSEMIRIEVFSLQGQRILSQELTKYDKYRFSISESPPGIYFMKVSAGEKAGYFKIDKH